jgi:uncharacterized protein (TIGR00369 family)
MSTPVPTGFVVHTRSSAVTKPWEPIFARHVDGSFQLGLVIAKPHGNSRGMLHGGVIAALADNAMGLTLGHALGGTIRLVTTALSVDYFGAGTPGQWLEIAPRVVAMGKRTGIVDAMVTADGVAIARANATFRVAPAAVP